MKPVTYGTRSISVGAHVAVRVWVGPHEGARGYAGELTLDPEQALDFQNRLTFQPRPVEIPATAEEARKALGLDEDPR